MRLIAPLIIALMGAGIGYGINYLFNHRGLAPPIAAVIGAISAFAGLILRDIFDWSFVSDPLFDSLLAALGFAIVVSVVAHIAMRARAKRE